MCRWFRIFVPPTWWLVGRVLPWFLCSITCSFAIRRGGRVLQNLGGIGNLTALPANAGPSHVLAFDTGPGNMVIDHLMQQLFNKPFDRGGKTGARGSVIKAVVSARLREPFFQAHPPKAAGREQFGSAYAVRFLAACRKAGGGREDAIATATALTAQSVGLAYSSFLIKKMRHAPMDFIVSGGGARNLTLMRMLRQQLEPLGCVRYRPATTSGCRPKPRRQLPSRCSRTRRGIGARGISLRQPVR